jgi:hypothetical protein
MRCVCSSVLPIPQTQTQLACLSPIQCQTQHDESWNLQWSRKRMLLWNALWSRLESTLKCIDQQECETRFHTCKHVLHRCNTHVEWIKQCVPTSSRALFASSYCSQLDSAPDSIGQKEVAMNLVEGSVHQTENGGLWENNVPRRASESRRGESLSQRYSSSIDVPMETLSFSSLWKNLGAIFWYR